MQATGSVQAMNWVLPILLLPMLLLSSCAARRTSAAAPAQTAAGRVALFNGRDINGWCAYLASHLVSREEVWQVRNGILVCKGEPMGYLYTARAFKNFRLWVEWRWAPGKEPGNSGIFLRLNREPRPLPRCIEVQLKSGNAGDLFAFHGMSMDGSTNRLRRISAHALGGNIISLTRLLTAENPPGEWNRAEISINGDRLVVVINGVRVNEAEGCEQIAGPIGLQSEGGEIHFRKVEIEMLPD